MAVVRRKAQTELVVLERLVKGTVVVMVLLIVVVAVVVQGHLEQMGLQQIMPEMGLVVY